jgi:hypothetical protein
MVRHGESENNLKKLFSGQQDCPLTEKGCKDAESIRSFMSKFKFDKVYSSDLCRTIQTAKIALPNCELETTALLRERALGTLENQPISMTDPDIQEAFKTESGEFDNAKFNSFYNDVLYIYNAAEEANIVGNMLNTFEYDPIDIFAPIGAKRKDVNATIYQVPNPERRSVSLVSIGGISDPTMSIREVGQTQQVFN